MAEEKLTKTTRRSAKAKANANAAEDKKASEAKTAEKKTARKTADKSKTKTAATKAERTKKPVSTAVSLDDLTTAVWKNIENKDVTNIPCAIAIQVNVFETGVFYIAVKANPNEDKQVMQANYYLADGIVDTSAEEVLKIAKGGYDFIEAVKSGRLNYRGDLSKAVKLADILNA